MLTVTLLDKCSLLYDSRLKSCWNATNIYCKARFERTILSDDSVSCICVVPTRTTSAAGYYFLAASVKRSRKFQSITCHQSTTACCNFSVHFWTHSCHVGWSLSFPARCSCHDAAAFLPRKCWWCQPYKYPRATPKPTVFSTEWYASSTVRTWASATVSTELLGLLTFVIPDQLSEHRLLVSVFAFIDFVESFIWVINARWLRILSMQRVEG